MIKVVFFWFFLVFFIDVHFFLFSDGNKIDSLTKTKDVCF
jgi:hypothetical protein